MKRAVMLVVAAVVAAGCSTAPDPSPPAPSAGGAQQVLDAWTDQLRGDADPAPPRPTTVADLLLPPTIQ